MRRYARYLLMKPPDHLVAIAVLSLLPAVGAAQALPTAESLQQEWHDVQVSGDRQARKEWWQHLSLDQLNLFVSAGVDITVSDRRGWTPLHSAARYNPDPDVLSRLVEAGANVNAKDRSGDTPLHWAAAENSNVGIITALIRAGAKVNAVDRFGWLPIHTAAENNANPEVLDALLQAGAKRKRRAYFLLFSPAFLLKHNPNMSEADKKAAIALLQERD